MADNVTLPGTGVVVASDDIGAGVEVQYVKLMNGASGAADLIGGEATNGLDVDPTRLPAGETHLGEVGGKTTITAITFSLPAATTAAGDLLADSQALSACLRINDGTGLLIAATFNDEDDIGGDLEVYVLDANTSLGTEDGAPNISDANARNILGVFPIASGDWKDLGGVKIACPNISAPIPVKGATGTDDIYLAIVDRTGGARSASGITARIGIVCD